MDDRRTYEQLQETYGEKSATWLATYIRDNPYAESRGHIQWKGTQPCMDLYCVCGYQGHVDADYFFSATFCPSCDRRFMVGTTIKLIEMTPEEVEAYGPKDFKCMNDFPSNPCLKCGAEDVMPCDRCSEHCDCPSQHAENTYR